MKRFTCFLCLFSFTCLTAQTSKNVENQIAINFLMPGVVYEFGVGPNSTITSELTFGFAYRESTFFEEGFGVYPVGRLQYRNYYNFDRRLSKNKRIEGNSGNYIAPTIVGQSGNALFGNLDSASRYLVGVGAVYGLQRTAPKGFQFRLEAGPAFFVDEFDNGFGFFASAKIGWVIRKKK